MSKSIRKGLLGSILNEESSNNEREIRDTEIEETSPGGLEDTSELTRDREEVEKKRSGGLLGMFSSGPSEPIESTSKSSGLSETSGLSEQEMDIESGEEGVSEGWYIGSSEIDSGESSVEGDSSDERDEEEYYEDVFSGMPGEIISPRISKSESREADNHIIERSNEIKEREERQVEQEVDEQEDDVFLKMMESLDEEEDIEKARARAILDEEIINPLVKKGADEIVVTSDGMTLEDILSAGRKGKKSTKQKLRELEMQEGVIEVGGKKYADDKYLKHIKSEEEKRERESKRVRDSLKFIKKNAKFTEQEIIIMKNLGLSSEKFAKLMKSSELGIEEKDKILSTGRHGQTKNFKGKRYRTTVGDTAIIEYLAKFKFANTRILRWIKDERQDRTWRKLNRLRDNGLVESHSIIGIPDLWGSTPAGIGLSGYSHEPGLRPFPKLTTISSTMGVNYLAACLWFNTVNVLNLEDFPAENRVIADQEDGRNRVRGEMLVSEYEIRRSLGQEISPQTTTMQTLGDERLYDIISSNVREEFDNWDLSGRVGESPEFALGNEYMWILYPTSQLTLSYHVPDLVVKRERGPNGEPRSIAVEVERHEKSSARYDQIMLAYKLDEHLYEKVIWVTPNTRTARALEKAAREVGFERYSILPIITKTGIYNKQDMWMI